MDKTFPPTPTSSVYGPKCISTLWFLGDLQPMTLRVPTEQEVQPRRVWWVSPVSSVPRPVPGTVRHCAVRARTKGTRARVVYIEIFFNCWNQYGVR